MVLSKSKSPIRMKRGAPGQPQATMPGPRGHFLFGSLLDIQRDPLAFLLGAHRRYGDTVKARLGLKTFYIVSPPRDVQPVLQETARNSRKGPHYELLKPVFG